MQRGSYIISISVASILGFSALVQDATNKKDPDASSGKIVQPDAPKVKAPSAETGSKVDDRDDRAHDKDRDHDRDAGTGTNMTSSATVQSSM